MDLQKLDLAQETRPYQARNAAISLLMVTNFSSVGEIANMTMLELSEAKEVALFFSVLR